MLKRGHSPTIMSMKVMYMLPSRGGRANCISKLDSSPVVSKHGTMYGPSAGHITDKYDMRFRLSYLD